MDKEKLGKKWICPTTGKKFYDLNKEPVTSPYTGELLEIINTEDLEKEKKEEIILNADEKENAQNSETDEAKDTDDAESDIEVLDDSVENSIEAPKFCIASIVFIISSLFKRPLILLFPIAIEDKITNLCEIDLSPGIKILPFNFLLLIDFIC